MTLKQTRYQTPETNDPRIRNPRLHSAWFALLTLIVIACAAIVLGGRVLAADSRLPAGTVVHGVAVGGLEPTAAEAALMQATAPLDTPVALVFGTQVWRPSAAEIGFAVDISGSVAQARPPASWQLLFDRVRERVNRPRAGQQYPLRITVDRAQIQAYVARVAPAIDQPAQAADLQLAGEQIVQLPAVPGQELDRAGAIVAIETALLTLAPQTIALTTFPIAPPVADSQIAVAAGELRTLLSGPITLRAADQSWTLSTAELAALAQLSWSDATPQRERIVLLDPNALRARLTPIANALEVAPVDAQVRFREGTLRITQPGRDGRALNIDAATRLLESALRKPSRSITLPVAAVPPQIRAETLGTLGVVELVARGRSSYAGSEPYRVQNIHAGAAQMDGLMIAPDAEFSFNANVGAIDETNGFTKGYAIIEGRTQLEWGGGVCQVSTTVFRAAYWAGVPITERNQHSFRIFSYETFEPIGMDAAIFTGPGGYDLRFVNDTDAWLLMQTSYDDAAGVLNVDLYGTKPDREVVQIDAAVTNVRPAPAEPRIIRDMTLPPGTRRQTDRARDGMDVQVGRIVRQNGVELRRDRFFSRYQAWPNIFMIGPEPPPAPTPDPNAPISTLDPNMPVPTPIP